MKNLLTLHEAIAVVLLNENDRTASFQTIAYEIESRQLFTERKGNIPLVDQIKLRTSIASSKYRHWFDLIKPDTIRLR